MRTLRLVALSDDGRSLVLSAEDHETGQTEHFELPIDDRVRAAARGDARLGAIPDLGNTLPPRVIQARIRAGETPEQVALASGTRVERIMRFAHPVLQERERIAERAREARVRLSEGSTVGTLEQFVAERLRLLGGDLDDVSWDAWRAADGSWLVSAAWRAGGSSGTTRWTYDPAARLVAALDQATTDFAEGTRLVRVVPDVPSGASAPVERPAVAPVERRPDPVPAPTAARDDIADIADGTDDEADPDDPFAGIADRDTVVLGPRGEAGDDEADDPRVRIPAWEDIVFGVRRHT